MKDQMTSVYVTCIHTYTQMMRNAVVLGVVGSVWNPVFCMECLIRLCI